jgi:hypothetical protein
VSDSPVFDRTREFLAERARLSPRDAAAALRAALGEAHLAAASIGRDEMILVARAALSRQLSARGVPDPERVCRELVAALARLECTDESPYEIFARLG